MSRKTTRRAYRVFVLYSIRRVQTEKQFAIAKRVWFVGFSRWRHRKPDIDIGRFSGSRQHQVQRSDRYGVPKTRHQPGRRDHVRGVHRIVSESKISPSVRRRKRVARTVIYIGSGDEDVDNGIYMSTYYVVMT